MRGDKVDECTLDSKVSFNRPRFVCPENLKLLIINNKTAGTVIFTFFNFVIFFYRCSERINCDCYKRWRPCMDR